MSEDKIKGGSCKTSGRVYAAYAAHAAVRCSHRACAAFAASRYSFWLVASPRQIQWGALTTYHALLQATPTTVCDASRCDEGRERLCGPIDKGERVADKR